MAYVIKDQDNRVLRFEGGESLPELKAGEFSEELPGDAPFFPDPPHQGAVLLWVAGQMQWLDTRTLEEAKTQRWEHMKKVRADKLAEPLPTPFGVFQAGEVDQKNITDAVLLAQTLAAAGQPVSISFTLADNSVAELTAAQMVQVGLLLGQRTQQVHATSRTLRALIFSGPHTTNAQVDAIDWPA